MAGVLVCAALGRAAFAAPAAPRLLGEELRNQRSLVEIGVMLGLFLPEKGHTLYDTSRQQRPLKDIGPAMGFRLGVMIRPWFAVEGEFLFMPTQTDPVLVAGEGGGDRLVPAQTVHSFGVRAQVRLQYPARFSPFLTLGGGVLGVASVPDAVGNAVSGVFTGGIGAQLYVTDWLALRADARQSVGRRYQGGRAAFFEILGGASIVLGWKRPVPPPPPRDSDGDGVIDAKDKCPNRPAKTADGCPEDLDGDGVLDDVDKCPKVPAKTPDGCPRLDRDGDGVPDAEDKCPDKQGPKPTGCPVAPPATKPVTP